MPPEQPSLDLSNGSSSATTMRNVLLNHEAKAVLDLKKIDGVVEIDSTSTPLDAGLLLLEHNLLAVPVWDPTEHKYHGFFDMRDILSAVVAEHKAVKGDYASDDSEPFLVKSMKELEEQKVTLKDLASRHAIYCCTLNDSLIDLCRLLSQPDCRRVLVCENKGERCTNMISRSTLIKYLSMEVPREALNETLDEAGLDYRKEVVSVRDDAPALDAFDLMALRGLYGIAVVDEDGTLLGNTSARDVKFAARGTAMDLDVLSYLAGVRQEDSALDGKKARYQACHVVETSTVSHALNLLAKTGYHRVFVTDQYLSPVGIISEKDILRFIEKSSMELPRDLESIQE